MTTTLPDRSTTAPRPSHATTAASAATAEPRTTARLGALVEDIRAVVDRGLPPALTAELVGECLAPHLGAADLLTPEQQEGDAACYRQHVLHAEQDGSFSVVALVWLPGQETCIHDHVSWCVAGVHQGEESEVRYALTPSADRARLRAVAHVVNRLGEVAGFAPPGDIHKVRNSCDTTAISIHVYGADVTRLGSSIRRIYKMPVD
ncbi:cysteine dioxygenase family protein [Streptomyces antimicrobicus]|uniref:Cysteine dioxygenase family protein n=1 Tax=Streptomyces antimicrobicus TaxID=2883108 RepID=A0ABS8BD67_9ACTN|nr:cysteine dioxygenase family protein [Streptomyces antimicrobicus]MCB5182565.1 cysteine dioxygenase family protein [Streptomyces antimicrobicus]